MDEKCHRNRTMRFRTRCDSRTSICCCCCWRRMKSSRKRKTEFYWVYRNEVPHEHMPCDTVIEDRQLDPPISKKLRKARPPPYRRRIMQVNTSRSCNCCGCANVAHVCTAPTPEIQQGWVYPKKFVLEMFDVLTSSRFSLKFAVFWADVDKKHLRRCFWTF